LMNELEPKIGETKMLELYKKCLVSSTSPNKNVEFTDAINLDDLKDTILAYKLGGYGKEFFGAYLESKRAKYKEMKKNKKK